MSDAVERLKRNQSNTVERMSRIEGMARAPSAPPFAGKPRSVTQVIRQTAHGFTVGKVVRPSVGGWAASDGKTPAGVVNAVINVDVFEVTLSGYISGLSGLVAGSTYADGSGTLQIADLRTGYSFPAVLQAISATEGIVVIRELQGIGFKEGVYILTSASNAWKNGTPLCLTAGSFVRAKADNIATSKVVGIISDVLYAIDASNNLVAVREAGICGASIDASWLASLSGVGTYYLSDTTAGDLTTTAPSSPSIPVAVLEVVRIGGAFFAMVNPSCTTPITWAAISGKPAAFPPSGSITLNIDSTDTTNAAALTFSGSIGAEVWTFYEKRPRFNAKWLNGVVFDTTAPTTKYQTIKYDPVGTKWQVFDQAGATPRDGDILYTDTAAADGYALVQAGLKQSVLGRSAATDGIPAPIQASTDGHVLGRTGGVVQFAAPSTFGAGGGFTPKTLVTFTSGSGNWTVPAGVTRVRAVCIGAGGSGASGTASTAIGSSGASVVCDGSQGGSGAMYIAEFDVVPGESVAYVVGAGGTSVTATNNGNAGAASTITLASGAMSANGGGGGGTGAGSSAGGPGGSVSGSVGSARNPIGYGWPGGYGIGGARIGAASWSSGGHRGFSVQGTAYGVGGDGASSGSSTAGGAGVVAFMY